MSDSKRKPHPPLVVKEDTHVDWMAKYIYAIHKKETWPSWWSAPFMDREYWRARAQVALRSNIDWDIFKGSSTVH